MKDFSFFFPSFVGTRYYLASQKNDYQGLKHCIASKDCGGVGTGPMIGGKGCVFVAFVRSFHSDLCIV